MSAFISFLTLSLLLLSDDAPLPPEKQDTLSETMTVTASRSHEAITDLSSTVRH